MNRDMISEEIKLASEALKELPVICDAELIGDLYRCASHSDWTFYARLYRKDKALLCYYARTECEWLGGRTSPSQSFMDIVTRRKNCFLNTKVICGIRCFPDSCAETFLKIMRTELPEQRQDGMLIDGNTYFLRKYDDGEPCRELLTYTPWLYMTEEDAECLLNLFSMIQYGDGNGDG